MLTLKESTLVLAKIRVHHGNAAITDLEARTFHEELRADMTLGEALEAVKRFYAGNDSGRWCGSGDVNAIVRRMRNDAKPSEAQIAEECEALGTGGRLGRGCTAASGMLGNGPDQAQRQALTMRNPFELPAAQPKPRSTASRCAGASRPAWPRSARCWEARDGRKVPDPAGACDAMALEATEIGGMSRPGNRVVRLHSRFHGRRLTCASPSKTP